MKNIIKKYRKVAVFYFIMVAITYGVIIRLNRFNHENEITSYVYNESELIVNY